MILKLSLCEKLYYVMIQGSLIYRGLYVSVEGVRKQTGYVAGDGKEKENPCTLHIFLCDFFIISGRLCGGGRIKVTILH